MSFSVLLLSIVFALIESGLTWMLLAFEPVASMFSGVPVWLLTGSVFALGMLLSYIIIIIVGALAISDQAADFVRDHFGRTLLLGLLSILLVFGLSLGLEAVYQMDALPAPTAPVQVVQQTTVGNADLIFALDYSSSMSGNSEVNMKAAFEQTINSLPDGQYVSVVRYDSVASTMAPWCQLNASTRAQLINAVKTEQTNGGTEFEAALKQASTLVDQAMLQGRACAVVMLSDGEDGITSVANDAPSLIANHVPVYTLYMGDSAYADTSTLQQISAETGGELKTSATDLVNLSTTMVSIAQQASNQTVTTQEVENDFIPDTLLTERNEGRTGLIRLNVLRMIALGLLCFVFKLIVVICVGNNGRFGIHFLHALAIAALATAVVEFGYVLGLPLVGIIVLFWVLMMGQIIITR